MSREDRKNLSVTTLVIGSLSSAGAAVIVHEIWRAGAILGAAATPVLVALFAEALRRPTEKLKVRSARALPSRSGETIRVYRTRPRWLPAVATGLVAFACGAAGLTASEALLQRSVADRDARTTLFDLRPPVRSDSAATPAPTVDPDRPRFERTRSERPADDRRERAARERSEKRAREPKARATPRPTPTATRATPTPTATRAAPTPSATPTPTGPEVDALPEG